MNAQTEKKLTVRQLEALESTLLHGNARMKRETFAGKTSWVNARVAGGALYRMLEQLTDDGFLSERLDDRELRDRFGEYGRKLTAKGLQALVAEAERRDDEPLFQLAAEKLAERAALEVEIAAAIAAKEAAEQAAAREENARRRAAHLAELQLVLDRYGLGDFAAGKSDDELLKFARDVEGAEYAYRETAA